MTIKVGDTMPDGIFSIMQNEKPALLTAKELLENKKVVLFAVPGAFTPGCSNNHLPIPNEIPNDPLQFPRLNPFS